VTAALRVAGSYRRCGWSLSFPPVCRNSRHFCSAKKIWQHCTFPTRTYWCCYWRLPTADCWITRTQVAVFVYLIVTVSRTHDRGLASPSEHVCKHMFVLSTQWVDRSLKEPNRMSVSKI